MSVLYQSREIAGGSDDCFSVRLSFELANIPVLVGGVNLLSTHMNQVVVV